MIEQLTRTDQNQFSTRTFDTESTQAQQLNLGILEDLYSSVLTQRKSSQPNIMPTLQRTAVLLDTPISMMHKIKQYCDRRIQTEKPFQLTPELTAILGIFWMGLRTEQAFAILPDDVRDEIAIKAKLIDEQYIGKIEIAKNLNVGNSYVGLALAELKAILQVPDLFGFPIARKEAGKHMEVYPPEIVALISRLVSASKHEAANGNRKNMGLMPRIRELKQEIATDDVLNQAAVTWPMEDITARAAVLSEIQNGNAKLKWVLPANFTDIFTHLDEYRVRIMQLMDNAVTYDDGRYHDLTGDTDNRLIWTMIALRQNLIHYEPGDDEQSQQAYFQLMNLGERAEEVVVKLTERMVDILAVKIMTANFRPYLYSELYSAGMMGLGKAMVNYKYNPNVKFSTYAWYAIEKAMKNAVYGENKTMSQIVLGGDSPDDDGERIGGVFTQYLTIKNQSYDEEQAATVSMRISKLMSVLNTREQVIMKAVLAGYSLEEIVNLNVVEGITTRAAVSRIKLNAENKMRRYAREIGLLDAKPILSQ